MNEPVESRESRVEGNLTPGRPPSGARPSTLDPRQHSNPGQRAWQRFRRNRAAVISAWYLIFLLMALVAWPIVLKVSGGTFAQIHNPHQLFHAQFAPPGAQHWFGTDVHGRAGF